MQSFANLTNRKERASSELVNFNGLIAASALNQSDQSIQDRKRGLRSG